MNLNWNELLNDALGAAIGTMLGLGLLGYFVFTLVIGALEAVF